MASVVKIKRSSVQGKAPTTSDIQSGELALNTKDGKLFSSDGSLVFEIGANLHSLFVGTGGITVGNGAFSFPTTDGSNSQVLVTDGSGNLTWQDQTGTGGGGGGNVLTLSSTAPGTANSGDTWVDSTTGIRYTYIDDGDTSQWVELEADVVISTGGAAGIALTDLDVITNSPSGNGSLSYNSSNGSFTFTPADATQGGGGSSVYTNQYALSGATSGNTETEIFVGGISATRIAVSTDTTLMFIADFVASGNGNSEYAVSHIRGAVRNSSGTTSNLGSLYEVSVATSNSSILFDARANDTNDSLSIYVQGLPSTSIDYKVVVSTIEV